MRTMTSVAREDTKAHPWRFPFYAAYMSVFIVPVPLMGATEATFFGTLGFISLRLTPWSRWVHDRLKDAFTASALTAQPGVALTNPAEHEKTGGRPALDKATLFRRAAADGWNDLKEAAGDFKQAVRRWWTGDRPAPRP